MITTGKIREHPAIWLENDALRISVLPDKGADIYELVHKPTKIDFLYKTFPGLQPPGEYPPMNIIENYEGGWQELFPNTNQACVVKGVTLPMHGEAALLPWEYTIMRNEPAETSMLFMVQTRILPFKVERTMRLIDDQPTLYIDQRVTNLANVPLDFVWGHHLMVGGTFLEQGCVYNAACQTIIIPESNQQDPHARLAPGKYPWPMARSRTSVDLIDLREIPGPEIRSHDNVYLTDLETGLASIVNPRLGLAFKLYWDAAIFGCISMWQPYGGLDIPPWTGSYGVGIEPWVTCANLAGALEHGKALQLKPGEGLETTLRVEISKI